MVLTDVVSLKARAHYSFEIVVDESPGPAEQAISLRFRCGF